MKALWSWSENLFPKILKYHTNQHVRRQKTYLHMYKATQYELRFEDSQIVFRPAETLTHKSKDDMAILLLMAIPGSKA